MTTTITPIKRTDSRLPPLPDLPAGAIGFDHIRPFWDTDESNPDDWEMINSPANLTPYSTLREHWQLTEDRYLATGDVRYGRDCALIKNTMGEEWEEWEKRCHSQAASQKKSAQHRANLSAAKKGHKHTEATKALMSAAKTGKKASDETRAKLSAAAKGNQHCLGKKASDETRAKQSAARKKYWAAKKAA